jgi:hypothetical protein
MTPNTDLAKLWEISTTRRCLRWAFRWRTLRRLLMGAGSLLTLVPLLYAVENWRGSRALGQHRKALEAKGETLRFAALAPPAVPDDQNFALCSLFKPALDYVRGSHGVQWRDPRGRQHLQSIYAAHPGGKRVQARSGDVFLNTRTDLASWQAFYRGNTNYPQPQVPGTPAQDVLVGLSRFDSDLNVLAQAAARPRARFPVEYECPDPFSILLPHLASIKSLATVLGLRATARLEAGQARAAFDDVKLGLRLADAVSEEPIVISHLVRIAALSITLQAVQEGLVRHAWTEAELAALQKRLAPLDLLAAHRRIMRAERAGEVTALEFYQREGWQYDPFSFSEDHQGVGVPPILLKVMPTGWVRQNELLVCRWIEDYPMAAVDAKQRRVAVPQAKDLDAAISSHRPGPYNFMARILVPSLVRVCEKTARAQTLADHALLACALERYRLAQGAYPERLAELAPRFVERVPHDLLDGAPTRFRRHPDGTWLIYSIGWNLKDDGGTIPTHREGSEVNQTDGDWVWRITDLPAR